MADHTDYKAWLDNPDDGESDPIRAVGWVLSERYKVTDYIGSGGFGQIYFGYNIALEEQRVIIKILKKSHDAEKFLKEAKILSLLDHPNICGIIDFLPDDRALVVPYIDGKDCQRLYDASGPLSEAMLIRVTRTILDALIFAHKRKVAHRDIKPGNIMIDSGGHVYLIDFGIAKQIGGTLTATGYRALTPQFAAPERNRGEKKYNPFLSDIYELGGTLYYLATGQPPYKDSARPDKRSWGGPEADKLAKKFRSFLKKATQPDPADRFQSAEKMLRAFSKIRHVYQHRMPLYLAIAAILVFSIAGIWIYHKQITESIRKGINVLSQSISNDRDTGKFPPDQGAGADSILRMPRAHGDRNEGIYGPSFPKIDSVPRPPEPTATVVKTAPRKSEPKAPRTDSRMPVVRVNILPMENAGLLVDNMPRAAGDHIPLKAAPHGITILHPDYPVFRDSVTIDHDRNLYYDLDKIFEGNTRGDITIGIVPPLRNGKLRMAFNNIENDYKLPAAGIRKIIGEWYLSLKVILSEQGHDLIVPVDSFRISGGSGQNRYRTISGYEELVDLAAIGENSPSFKIIVYWRGE